MFLLDQQWRRCSLIGHISMINVPALRESNIIRDPLQLQLFRFRLNAPWQPWLLPASLPAAAGRRLGRPRGDDLAVDGAEQQHKPDGAKHLGGWDAMIVVDGGVEERRCHWGGGTEHIHQMLGLKRHVHFSFY